MTGTKIKQRRRAQSKRTGLQTQPAKRASRENLGTFAKGQKLRNGERMSERYTAAIVRGAALTRTLTPRQRQKLSSEAPGASRMTSPWTRKRTALRAAGMRYTREVGPGLNVNAPGRWLDATGVSGIPTIGTARVHVRRMARQWYQSEMNAAREMISSGRGAGMTTSATLEAEGDAPQVS
jgi:hypothetical protein